jgi:ABC-2 type transport system ATP-binding protein
MSMAVLEVEGLRKTYPGFVLDGLSFQVERGSIMGFIGRNGAGKTTTLKSILHIVRPDGGSIRYFGMDLEGNEGEIKRRVGYAVGAVNYYPRRRLKDLAEVTARFYPNWDWDAYRRYLEVFRLDESKTPSQLSEGMRVKLSLTVALSHRAELLILDEPTSGLDPVSREELLDIFRYLRDQGTAVLFSTHITTDLEKCADHITYIADGRRIASEPLAGFLERCRREGRGKDLEEIMVFTEKEDLHERLAH